MKKQWMLSNEIKQIQILPGTRELTANSTK